MPTVLREEPYRFYFWSHELHEPPHIHVDREDKSVKYWLQPVSVAKNRGPKAHELNAIKALVIANEQQLLEAWHAHFP